MSARSGGWWFLLLLSLFLLALGASTFVTGVRSHVHYLTVEDSDRDLGEIQIGDKLGVEHLPPDSPGRNHSVSFTVKNPGSVPAAIIGAESLCGDNACINIELPGRVTIQPGSSFDVNCLVYIKAPGSFQASLPLHLDDGRLRTIILSVRGNAVPSIDVKSP